MLKELFIEDLALIERISLEFSPGLNIFTGETGAGKTLIIGGLNLLLGERGDTSLIRVGAKTCRVEGIFFLTPPLKNFFSHLFEEDLSDEIFLARTISQDGKSRSYLNGRPIPLNLLHQIGEKLVDIHGQHEHQVILKTSSHLDYLDSYGGKEIATLKNQFFLTFQETKKIQKELFNLKEAEKNREREEELLKFQIEDIERAQLQEGEEEELKKERDVLRNLEKIHLALAKAIQLISEDAFSSLEQLRQAEKELSPIANYDQRIEESYLKLKEVIFTCQEICSSFRDYIERLEFDPNRLEELESRLNLIELLKKKYGQSIPEILAYLDKIKREVASFKDFVGKIAFLEEELKSNGQKLKRLGEGLSLKRKEVARDFESKVESELKLLDMGNTQFKVSLSQENSNGEGIFLQDKFFSPTGIDKIEFLISPNKGEPLKPLSKIASGGEISRIVLALKIILGEVDQIPTLIFDEIDVGIGGKTASMVGRLLSNLCQNHQVICVTHLPQIASFADRHFYIFKEEEVKRTKTKVKLLNEEERVKEIARMLSGAKILETSLKHARQLIQVAKRAS